MKKYFWLILTVLIALPAISIAQWSYLPTIPGPIDLEELARPTYKIAATQPVVSEEEAVIKTYENLLPSVVSILITEKVSNDLGEVSLQETGGGTGFFISSDGYIITNKHVVLEKNVNYTVITNTNKEYVGSVLARDPLFDIAIMKIEGTGFKPAKLGDSDKIRIAQSVIAIGNVLTEFKNSVTRGIISGVGRTITASGSNITETIEGAIQTDASINPGNSGGPLVNLNGEVIGINTAVSQEGQNIGFAIPANVIRELLANYQASGGKISRPFLGIRYKVLDKETAVMNDLAQGAYIVEVVEDSNAAKAGLKPGQVISRIDGQKITKENDITNLIKEHEVGDQLILEVWDQGQKSEKTVVLGQYE